MIAQAGFYSMFFFITLYMQNVLGYSPIAAGAAYVPVTIGVGISSGIATKVISRTGTRPVIMAGTLLGAAGVFWLSRVGVHGSYAGSILPGLVVMALGPRPPKTCCGKPSTPARSPIADDPPTRLSSA